MFFAPALTTNAIAAPNRTPSDFGLERFMRDALGGLVPSVFHDVEEDERSWTIRLDVPGVPREQLRVQVRGKTVDIETDQACRRRIRASYTLPAEIDPEKTQAHLQDGVLTLQLAKTESAVTRRVEVK